ncbi:unnamed protein product [Brassica rapa]|uniref:Transmembrane protein n=2 Tax=Brassica TaxID=3705 RepID=A0A8D9M329_BRACM|nr:unnamed protein product [Brassica napus]CAG7896767.1 unnamed protein product [Brassica rapa]CDY16486.1 BnaA08g02810D [Brassica napus]
MADHDEEETHHHQRPPKPWRKNEPLTTKRRSSTTSLRFIKTVFLVTLLFTLFFIFLAVVFASLSQPSSRLQCRHCWAPICLLSFSHLIFYISVAQTLRCINGFKYQRRCHKLTLGLATEKLRFVKTVAATAVGEEEISAAAAAGDLEVPYQEPSESYLGKFKRNWALYFGFLILLYAFLVSFSVVVLCF